MKKIEMFSDTDEKVVKEYVNKFTAEHPFSVIDIQYRDMGCGYSVMIVYDTSLESAYNKVRGLGNKLRSFFEGGDSN